MAGIGLNPSGCCCGPCTGTLCVTLTGTCSPGNAIGYSIKVYDHTTSVLVASAVTNSVGHVCLTVPSGSYDVVGTKASYCSTITWANQLVTCGATLNLTGIVACEPDGNYHRFNVVGCGSFPLPGAVITITGPTTGSTTTDGSGTAYFFPTGIGLYSYTISHPSGRFATSSGTWTQGSFCVVGTVNAGLNPAAGFVCCAITNAASSPYPVPATLYVHDAGGSISFTACIDTPCAVRTMGDVSSCGSPACVTVSCTGGGTGSFPPAIGSGTAMVKYSIVLTATPTAKQDIPQYPVITYRGDHATSGFCTPVDTGRAWRIASTCSYGGATTQYSSSGFTLNSAYPLNVTFNFPAGPGFGPNPIPGASPTGSPYATSIVISETP